jgi:hypothetical protein
VGKSDYKKTEEKLRDYLTGNLSAQIQHRKDILEYPPKPSIKQPKDKKKKEIYEVDIKTKSTLRPDGLERKVLKYADDPKYNLLKKQRDAIHGFLTRLMSYDYDTYRTLVLFYRDKRTWLEVSEELHVSESTCKRRRKGAVNDLRKILFPSD